MRIFCSSVVHCLFWRICIGFHFDHWQCIFLGRNFLLWTILFLCIRNRLVGSWDGGRTSWGVEQIEPIFLEGIYHVIASV